MMILPGGQLDHSQATDETTTGTTTSSTSADVGSPEEQPVDDDPGSLLTEEVALDLSAAPENPAVVVPEVESAEQQISPRPSPPGSTGQVDIEQSTIDGNHEEAKGTVLSPTTPLPRPSEGEEAGLTAVESTDQERLEDSTVSVVPSDNQPQPHSLMINGLCDDNLVAVNIKLEVEDEDEECTYRYREPVDDTMATMLDYQQQTPAAATTSTQHESNTESDHGQVGDLVDAGAYPANHRPLLNGGTTTTNTNSAPASPLDDNNNTNGSISGHIKSPAESRFGSTGTPSPSPSPTAAIVIANQAQYKQTLEYLKQLFGDREHLRLLPFGLFAHLGRLLEQEIQRVRASLIHIDGSADQRPALVLPEPEGPTVTRSTKIYVPVDKYPDLNFIGRIIGPRGLTIRELEVDCGCKLYIRGRGSLRDRNKEEKLKSQANWEHLNDELHVLITVEDAENRAKMKLERAEAEINKLLDSVITNKDEFKMRQLAELAILNDKFKAQQSNAQDVAAQLQILQAAVSNGGSVVSQAAPPAVAVAGAPLGHHQLAGAAQVQQLALQQLSASHQQHHAAAVAQALQAQATQQQHQQAALAAHAAHAQVHPSAAMASAIAASQQAAAAAANYHQLAQRSVAFNALYGHHAPQAAAFAPGLEAAAAHGALLFNAQQAGLVQQSALLQEAMTPALAVQFPVAGGGGNTGGNKRYHPYGKKKN